MRIEHLPQPDGDTPAPAVPAAGLLSAGGQAMETGDEARDRSMRGRLAAIVLSHTMVDTYSAFVPPIVGVLQVRASLTDAQAAWLIGIGSLASGASQPLSAWLTDRFDSRRFGMLGLLIAAVCLSCIGFVDGFGPLVAVYATGMIGVGIFHPVGASSMGELTERAHPGRRSMGISFFFVAGMTGGVIGSMVSTRLSTLESGFNILALCMIPGLIVAVLLHRAIHNMPHRAAAHREVRFVGRERAGRWFAIALLYVGNAMRSMVNIALVYLIVRLTERWAAEAHAGASKTAVAEAAAPVAGNMNAVMIVGMAIGGLTAGMLVKPGREKWPVVLIPMVISPAIALLPSAGPALGLAAAFAAGVGFAAMAPVTIGLAQRLLPHRTGLASSLMLGGAWAFALLGPALAEWCMDTHTGPGLSMQATFGVTAAWLAASGVIGLALPGALLGRVGGSVTRRA